MAVITLPKGSIMHFIKGGVTFIPTEHGRQELSVDKEPIGESRRMANGRLRSQHVIDKHAFSVSWSETPAQDAGCYDGNKGGAAIEQFFEDNKGDFILRIRNSHSGLDGDYTVQFEGGFSKTHQMRGKWDFWAFSINMVEV